MTLYQIDAFTDKLFKGNPAAVIPLDNWIDESLMQNIAMENNLAETAFICPVNEFSKASPTGGDSEGADFEIRWFTPEAEIDLCGHATLASAYVLFNIMKFDKEEIKLSCKSGILKVRKEGDIIWMDFPSWKPERFNDYPAELALALGNSEIVGVYKHRDLLVELMNEDAVKKCNPDFTMIKKTSYKIIITAQGKDVDFVSRFFAPTVGINEDPVTGSAHSQLIPFWSEKLGKQKLSAMQLSRRTGKLLCEQNGDRVKMGGNCVYYMKGEIEI
jgi:PhzF family phenazine biosynthesis protein